MTLTPYTEDTLVQKTTADYLAQELGWQSVLRFSESKILPLRYSQSELGRWSNLYVQHSHVNLLKRG